MFNRLALAAALLSSSLAAGATQMDLVIPAAGSGPGALGSTWQTEVTLYNAGSKNLAVSLSFHSADGALVSIDRTIDARKTISLDDIVGAEFHFPVANGGISIDVKDDAGLEQLAVTSRTFNVSPAGEYGQDIAAVSRFDAIVKGYSGVVTGPSTAEGVRFNFGIFALEDSQIEWLLVRQDGTIAKTLRRSYEAEARTQFSRGVETLFGAEAQDNDVIQANVLEGRAVFFGSIVNNQTGDPTFVPQVETRDRLPIEFLGVDRDENGSIDIQANGDTLVSAVPLKTGSFPNYFKVVAEPDVAGTELTYELVDAPFDVTMLEGGVITWAPSGGLQGGTGSLTVRISDGFRTADVQIPVRFF